MSKSKLKYLKTEDDKNRVIRKVKIILPSKDLTDLVKSTGNISESNFKAKISQRICTRLNLPSPLVSKFTIDSFDNSIDHYGMLPVFCTKLLYYGIRPRYDLLKNIYFRIRTTLGSSSIFYTLHECLDNKFREKNFQIKQRECLDIRISYSARLKAYIWDELKCILEGSPHMFSYKRYMNHLQRYTDNGLLVDIAYLSMVVGVNIFIFSFISKSLLLYPGCTFVPERPTLIWYTINNLHFEPIIYYNKKTEKLSYVYNISNNNNLIMRLANEYKRLAQERETNLYMKNWGDNYVKEKRRIERKDKKEFLKHDTKLYSPIKGLCRKDKPYKIHAGPKGIHTFCSYISRKDRIKCSEEGDLEIPIDNEDITNLDKKPIHQVGSTTTIPFFDRNTDLEHIEIILNGKNYILLLGKENYLYYKKNKTHTLVGVFRQLSDKNKCAIQWMENYPENL